MTLSWTATCIQMPTQIVSPCESTEAAAARIQHNLRTALELIDQAVEADPRPALIVLPEYAFTGQPDFVADTAAGKAAPIREWLERACGTVPGPLTAPLQDAARRHGVYLGANQFEHDAGYGDRFFNTSSLISPDGQIVLRYRRVHTSLWTSPHDVLNQYLEAEGWEGLWPVVDTDLGRIGIIPCGEIMVPEVARTLALRGAEVVLHLTWEEPSVAQDAAKVLAGAANLMYVISCNVAASLNGDAVDNAPNNGDVGSGTRILDYRGHTLAERNDHGTGFVSATIDVGAVRAARGSLSMANHLLRLRPETFAATYAATTIYPPDYFADRPALTYRDVDEPSAEARENLTKLGVRNTAGPRTTVV